MTRTRAAGAVIGVVFGVVLSWSLMSDPAVVQATLRFEDPYLFLFFGSAFATAAIGLQLVRRFQSRALLTGGPIGWAAPPPERRHVVGSLIFGAGWGVSGACPGPIATQIGQGVPWALVTLAGVVGGVLLSLRGTTGETEPAADVV